jgi:hypothetical protein
LSLTEKVRSAGEHLLVTDLVWERKR